MSSSTGISAFTPLTDKSFRPSSRTLSSIDERVVQAVPSLSISSSEQLQTLLRVKKYLDVLAKYLPLPEVKQFDPERANPAMMNLLFHNIGFSYAFDADVKDVMVEHFGRFERRAPLLKGDLLERAKACEQLLERLLPKLAAIYKESRKQFFLALFKQMGWNCDLLEGAPEELDAFLLADSTQSSVKELQFRGVAIDILPPEINLFKHLASIDLRGSNIKEYAHVLRGHPNKVHVLLDLEELVRNRGFSSDKVRSHDEFERIR